MNPLHGLSIFIFAIGALLLFLSRYLKRKNQAWMLNAEPVKGVLQRIEDIESASTVEGADVHDKEHDYYLHIKYSVNNEEYTLRHYNGSNSWGYDVNDEIDLRYNVDNHADAKLYSWWTVSGAYGFVSIGGLVFIGLALYTLYKAFLYVSAA
ncbi:MAG: DUF3592 domain-containing protein [Cyclobacteriaceae bacterium]